jgi:23S rRNA (adenine-N6)-dimethyltransferase
MRNRIKYSQNFLKDKQLIESLLNKSSIQKTDVVYEIGAGQGIITTELIKRSEKVVAFEIDNNLFNKLTDRFKNERSLELHLGNFLDYPLPNQSYKVFSNIPFNITSAIIKKLTQSTNPPEDTYLIVQREASSKFIGKPEEKVNSLLSILIKSNFNITIFYRFNRNDFFPKPNVDIVMLRIQKLDKSAIPTQDVPLFFDFSTYVFSQFKPNILEGLSKIIERQKVIELARKNSFSTSLKPSELDFNHWLILFDIFVKASSLTQKRVVQGSYKRLQLQQNNLQKINRTRNDKNWKNLANQKN